MPFSQNKFFNSHHFDSFQQILLGLLTVHCPCDFNLQFVQCIYISLDISRQESQDFSSEFQSSVLFAFLDFIFIFAFCFCEFPIQVSRLFLIFQIQLLPHSLRSFCCTEFRAFFCQMYQSKWQFLCCTLCIVTPLAQELGQFLQSSKYKPCVVICTVDDDRPGESFKWQEVYSCYWKQLLPQIAWAKKCCTSSSVFYPVGWTVCQMC